MDDYTINYYRLDTGTSGVMQYNSPFYYYTRPEVEEGLSVPLFDINMIPSNEWMTNVFDSDEQEIPEWDK
jgi:hypothetical protein